MHVKINHSPTCEESFCLKLLILIGIFFFFNQCLSAATAKSLQSCPTLCDPIDGSPPHSAVPGILQARTLEWVAISFSNVWMWKVKVKLLSCSWLLVTPWTAAHQALLSTRSSRQDYWSGLPFPSPLSDPGEYQTMRTHTKETTWIQDPASPNHQ